MAVEINTELNNRIKQARLELGISQRAFADSIGISAPALSKIESNDNNPSEQTLRMICNQYSINREWLETGEGPMLQEPDAYDAVMRVMMGDNEQKKELIRIIAEMPDELLGKLLEFMEYLDSKRHR
jgi:transcriptional regulator with XRE-family HTH domain